MSVCFSISFLSLSFPPAGTENPGKLDATSDDLASAPMRAPTLPVVVSAQRVYNIYESIATVGEIQVWWRADFQSGSRVLKRCSEPFLIYIYGIQCDFMPKSC